MAFASFDKQRASAPVAEINMVPLIDVMLVLLVIFIIAAPLLTHTVKLQLPEASTQATTAAPDKIDFAIDAAGDRYWNGEPLSRAEAAERFRTEGAKATPPEVHLSADQSVPYRVIAETLADASNAGVTKIGFVSEPDAAAPVAPTTARDPAGVTPP